jgi:hypothetical protein
VVAVRLAFRAAVSASSVVLAVLPAVMQACALPTVPQVALSVCPVVLPDPVEVLL